MGASGVHPHQRAPGIRTERPHGPRQPCPGVLVGFSRGVGGRKRVGIATTRIPSTLRYAPNAPARTIGAGRLRRLEGHDPSQSPGTWRARSTSLLSGCQEPMAAEEASIRAVHILPISTVSRQAKSQEGEAPNACVFNRCRQTMGGALCHIQVPNAAKCIAHLVHVLTRNTSATYISRCAFFSIGPVTYAMMGCASVCR